MIGTRQNKSKMELNDDNKSEENGDLGSFTELQVRLRALICVILHGLESEPMFDKVMSEATINGDVNGLELSVPYQLQ